MKPRERLTIGAAVGAMLAAVLLLAWPSGAPEAVALPSIDPAPAVAAMDTAEDEGTTLVARIEEPVDVSPTTVDGLPPPPVEHVDGKGTIYGYLRMPVELLRDIDLYTIRVAEEHNENLADLGDADSERKLWSIQRGFANPGDTTPRFEIRDVPFSRHGYRVSVHVPNHNGSFRIVRLDANKPVVEETECVLSVSRGAPYSVRLRDQRMMPVTGTLVYMEPTGDEPGLCAYEGTTDNYGAILFEAVLQGTYAIYVGDKNAPWVEPQEVRVSSHTPVFPGKPVTPQGTMVRVPTGQPAEIQAVGPGGYGLEGIEVTLKVINTIENHRLQATTDYAGTARFPHVSPGTYEVDWSHPDFHRRTRMLKVEDGVPPNPLKVTMIPR